MESHHLSYCSILFRIIVIFIHLVVVSIHVYEVMQITSSLLEVALALLLDTSHLLCLDPETSRVFISRHVKFDEFSFPYANDKSSSRLPKISKFFEPISKSSTNSCAPSPCCLLPPTTASSSLPCSLCPPDSFDKSAAPMNVVDEPPPTDQSHVTDPLNMAPTAIVPRPSSSSHPMQT